ncbi:MAG: hypothetical protein J2P36_11265 [Ktedonobacteraceae bacterium]|nr:hypothetical protein [Ktedonobacteraceae bacterium]
MNGYVCVYRHRIPPRRDRRRTESAAASNSTLRRFLEVYDDQNCFYDWGDDPSFFAASEQFGDVHGATWGVCRPNVRKLLRAGDYVVFFCAKQIEGSVWDYFYIGVGTVSLGLTRQTIWSDDQYAKYRSFFNILARLSGGVLEQHEAFHRYHKDWQKRCEAPYWLFAREQSQFNLANPLHVAAYTGTRKTVETWLSSQDQQVALLEAILFPPFASRRRLRTIHPQISHHHINLRAHLGPHADLNVLRAQLIALATDSS